MLDNTLLKTTMLLLLLCLFLSNSTHAIPYNRFYFACGIRVWIKGDFNKGVSFSLLASISFYMPS